MWQGGHGEADSGTGKWWRVSNDVTFPTSGNWGGDACAEGRCLTGKGGVREKIRN